jgi:hypothetical protein
VGAGFSAALVSGLAACSSSSASEDAGAERSAAENKAAVRSWGKRIVESPKIGMLRNVSVEIPKGSLENGPTCAEGGVKKV